MSNDLPPAESYPKSPQPLDIVAIGGMIIDGRVHATSTSPTSATASAAISRKAA